MINPFSSYINFKVKKKSKKNDTILYLQQIILLHLIIMYLINNENIIYSFIFFMAWLIDSY